MSKTDTDRREQIESRNLKVGQAKGLMEAEFPTEFTVCPQCGQELPSDKRESLYKRWKGNNDYRIAELKNDISSLSQMIEALTSELDEYQAKKIQLMSEIKDAKAELDHAKVELDAACEAPEIVGADLPEYRRLADEIAVLQSNSVKAENDELKRNQIGQHMEFVKAEIAEINGELKKEEVNAATRKKIEEKNEERRSKGQEKSNAEKILSQIADLNMEKNRRLEESVNSNFPDYIRFRLFKVQKNGEIKDDCVPLIKDENGDWKDCNQYANTGLKVLAKLGIIEGIQRYYDQHLPVFLDNAECIDSKTRSRIDIDTQLILLTVKDGEKLTCSRVNA